MITRRSYMHVSVGSIASPIGHLVLCLVLLSGCAGMVTHTEGEGYATLVPDNNWSTVIDLAPSAMIMTPSQIVVLAEEMKQNYDAQLRVLLVNEHGDPYPVQFDAEGRLKIAPCQGATR